MDKFEYRAKDKSGGTVKGLVEAKDEQQAARILRERQLLVVFLKLKGKGFVAQTEGGLFRGVSFGDKVNFTRQLATMMTAGLPLTDSLSLLEVQAKPALGKIIGEILREIEGGGTLASAMEKHPDVFDPVYLALVKSGESAGVLDKLMARLADNLEKEKEFKSKVKGAMIYPIIVVVGMVIVMMIMVVFVIPKMTAIYADFNAELPVPTKIMLAISHLLTSFWWLGLILVAGAVFGFRILSKSPGFREQYDRIIFSIPIIGNLKKQMTLTEFTRTLGLLVGAGILIVDALEIVRGSLGSSVYENAMIKVGKDVERGLPLASALAKTEVFPQLLSQMVAVGEETGKLDEVLAKVSVYFEQAADGAVKALTTAMEPLIMVVLGFGVGFLIISVITPIYNLTSQF